MAPNHVGCVSSLAMELSRAGRFAEALLWHRKAIALDPGHPGRLTLYSITLQKSGDHAAALAVLEEIAAMTEGDAIHAQRMRTLRARMVADARDDRPWAAWRQRLLAVARQRG